MVDAKYMRNGNLSLYDVAADIKTRKLTAMDIDKLVNEPIVQSAFFGDLAPLKQPKRKWSKKYLDELCIAPAFKCFNREYLLYLDEVAEYVSKKKRWMPIIIILASIAAIALVGAILFALEILG